MIVSPKNNKIINSDNNNNTKNDDNLPMEEFQDMD